MGTFDEIRQQVGPMPPQVQGRFATSSMKRDMVMQRTAFWVTGIDPRPRPSTRFVSQNGQAKEEWIYHCVPLQGGEEFILTLSRNWSRDREVPLLIQRLQQTGQPLGPAILAFEIPPGGTRAMHTLRDWNSPPVPFSPPVNPQQALAAATAAPPISSAPQAWPTAPSVQPPPVIPWKPVQGVPIAPQPTPVAGAVIAPPSPAPAPPPPAGPPGVPILEGGRPVGLGPDGQPPLQYACGCLATRTTRQVYQPCAVHSGQPVVASQPVPPIAQLTQATHVATAQTATAVCPRCQQQITGEVTQVGVNRYVTHNNCPADPNPQAYQLLKV